MLAGSFQLITIIGQYVPYLCLAGMNIVRITLGSIFYLSSSIMNIATASNCRLQLLFPNLFIFKAGNNISIITIYAIMCAKPDTAIIRF